MNFSCKATVSLINSVLNAVQFDQTPFYPQGGGQQGDRGHFDVDGTLHIIINTKCDGDGNIWHMVESLSVDLYDALGKLAHLEVDQEFRSLNTISHSAGHLLDHAVEDLKLPWRGLRGYHFLAGPYVEFSILDELFDCSRENLGRLLPLLEEAANSLVRDKLIVNVFSLEVSKLSSEQSDIVPENVLKSGLVRFVQFGTGEHSYAPLPCGGTHVRNTGEIGQIKIRKISRPDAAIRVIRVSYALVKTLNN